MDVGVIMHKSANPSRQCVDTEQEANSTVGKIRRKIVNRVKDTIVRIRRLYKPIVRPQLKYYIQVVIARNRTRRNRIKYEQELAVFNVK